ncbi:MAG: hypothetical protein MI919_11145, partial [Holophagales bacterium]|nr:hypothetical protein [Holophagales bacterium]
MNTDDSELISAASNPATTMPLTPTGSKVPISVGNASSGCPRSSRPLSANAWAITPGMTKMK